MNLLSYIVAGDFPSLLIWAVGVLICLSIAWLIVKQLDLPPLVLKIVLIIGLFLLLVLVVDFFRGYGGGAVIVR